MPLYEVTYTWYVEAPDSYAAIEATADVSAVAVRVRADPCGNYPAPCNCDEPHPLSR